MIPITNQINCWNPDLKIYWDIPQQFSDTGHHNFYLMLFLQYKNQVEIHTFLSDLTKTSSKTHNISSPLFRLFESIRSAWLISGSLVWVMTRGEETNCDGSFFFLSRGFRRRCRRLLWWGDAGEEDWSGYLIIPPFSYSPPASVMQGRQGESGWKKGEGRALGRRSERGKDFCLY